MFEKDLYFCTLILKESFMYQLIKQLHSFTAYIVLAVLIAAVVNALTGYFKHKKYFEVKDLRLTLFALIFSHIQMLLGLLVYVTTPRLQMWGEGAKVEHPLMNIIAIVLITVGWVKLKKQTEVRQMFGKIALFYGIALVLLLSRIPWGLWLGFS